MLVNYAICRTLDLVRQMTIHDDRPTDPYADVTAAPFYRLPAGFRREKKFLEKEQEGMCSVTN